MSTWRQATVADVASGARNALVGGPFGSDLVSRDYVDAGVPVIRGTNLSNGRWISGEFVHVSPAKADALAANCAAPGDLVFTQRGTLGQVALVPTDQVGRYLISQSQMKLTVDETKVDPLFLYYVFTSGQMQEYIRLHAIQTGVPHINLGILRETPIPLPPLGEQRGIAATLGALDDKIESNRRLEDLSLDLAESLYVDACARGAGVVALGDAGRWLSGGTPSTSSAEYWGGDLPWISAASLKSFYVAESDRTLTKAGAAAATNIVPAGTVLMVVRGMSLKTEFRFGVAQRPVAFGQDVKAILPSIGSSVLAIALRAARADILGLVDEAGHGTGRLQSDRLEAVRVAVPTDPAFAEAADALIARGSAAAEENAALAALRDALLPELLSGRIRVQEAAEAVAHATT